MKKVQVLLSTFNGAKFIQQQLNSIFHQKDVEIFCLVRDDGSTDETIEILMEYQHKHENLSFIRGNNIGYKLSFQELLKLSGKYDYYAFADQDDVWEPLKLKVAVEEIVRLNKRSPTMYFSNCTVVNSKLEKIGMLHSKENIVPEKKATALVQGFAHGCTMVFNKISRDLILNYQPEQIYAHDFWIPLLHIYLGDLIYDSNSYILYRQHNQNVFGEKRSLLELLTLKFNFTQHSKNYHSGTAKDLLNGYSNSLRKTEYKQLKDIAEYRHSLGKLIKLLFNKDIKRNTIRGTLILKMLIISARF